MASSTLRPAWHEPSRIAALWFGMLAGPLVWLALLQFTYVMSYVACEAHEKWFLHAGVAVSLAVVAFAGWLARRSGPAEDEAQRSAPGTRTTAEIRTRWMSMSGVWLSVWFLLVILAMEVPLLILETCQ